MIKTEYLKMPFIALIFLISSVSYAEHIRPYESTRLLSTGGAGVASLLVHESVMLNPAPVAFFNNSFLYTQRDSDKLEREGQDRSEEYKTSKNNAYIVTDSSGAMRGSFAHIDYSQNNFSRKQYSLSMSSATSKKSAFGINYTYAIDKNYGITQSPKNLLDIGYISIYSKEISLGFVYKDAGKAIKGQSRMIGGFHYNLSNILAFIVDYEIDPSRSYEKYNATKAAIQFSIIDSILLRIGYFIDSINQETGQSYGLSWIGPKLAFEYGLKKIHLTGDNPDKNLYKDDELYISSLSMAFRF